MVIKQAFNIIGHKSKEECINYWNKIKMVPNHPEVAPDLGWPIAISLEELYDMIIVPRSKLLNVDLISRNDWLSVSSRSLFKWEPRGDSFINTLRYLWFVRGKCSYVAFDNDGSIFSFVPFINPNYENMWDHSILSQCQMALKREKHEKLLSDVRQWNTIGCLLANEDPIQVRGGGWGIFLNMFMMASQKMKKRLDFFFHRYDHPIATLSGVEPFYHIFGSFDKPIKGIEPQSVDNPLNWYRILGNTSGELYVERPIPTADEWELVTQEYFPSHCLNSYIDSIKDIPWKNRVSKAIWRGGLSGCGLDENTNIRLKLALMNEPNLMDIGITGWGMRMKVEFRYGKSPKIGKIPVGYLRHKYNLEKAPLMSRSEQQRYKYVIDIPGNNENPGYRFAWEMMSGFVILWVGEPIKAREGEGSRRLNLWFWDQLKAWEHYVPVSWDLSDLKERILWCQEHDKECEEIAKNAKRFAKKNFTRNRLRDVIVKSLK